MNRPFAVAARITRWWVRVYTARVPPETRELRRAQVDSDLWEQQHDAADAHRRPMVAGGEVMVRVLLGVAADLSWQHTQAKGGPMGAPVDWISTAEAARILGVSRRDVIELTTNPQFPPSRRSSSGGLDWSRDALREWARAHSDPGPVHRGPAIPPAGSWAPQVSRVAQLAAAEARALNHGWVGTEHLLLALTHPDCPGAAPAVLASLGITSGRLRQSIVAAQGDAFEPGAGWTAPAPATRSVLERAHLEAVQLADAEVTSEHVLLALAGHWADDPATVAGLHARGIDPADVRRRVLDHTEGATLPPPTEAAPPRAERQPEAAWPRELELAPTPNGEDPRQRGPWGSAMFVDGDGQPIKRADGLALQQYLIDRDGHPVLTADGRPVHLAYDDQGQWVLDEEGRPVVVPVEIPEGSTL